MNLNTVYNSLQKQAAGYQNYVVRTPGAVPGGIKAPQITAQPRPAAVPRSTYLPMAPQEIPPTVSFTTENPNRQHQRKYAPSSAQHYRHVYNNPAESMSKWNPLKWTGFGKGVYNAGYYLFHPTQYGEDKTRKEYATKHGGNRGPEGKWRQQAMQRSQDRAAGKPLRPAMPEDKPLNDAPRGLYGMLQNEAMYSPELQGLRNRGWTINQLMQYLYNDRYKNAIRDVTGIEPYANMKFTDAEMNKLYDYKMKDLMGRYYDQYGYSSITPEQEKAIDQYMRDKWSSQQQLYVNGKKPQMQRGGVAMPMAPVVSNNPELRQWSELYGMM